MIFDLDITVYTMITKNNFDSFLLTTADDTTALQICIERRMGNNHECSLLPDKKRCLYTSLHENPS